MTVILLSVAFAGVVAASLSGNLNYRSPSARHPTLSISSSHIAKRQANTEFLDPSQLSFTHGVASGDPYADSVILWTRVSPQDDNVGADITPSGIEPAASEEDGSSEPSSNAGVCVEYAVATDEGFTDVVDSGEAFTSAEVDYTVKVEAKNLQPFTTYYYQFNVCNSGVESPVGRTKTTPAKDDVVESDIRIAVYSCSNYPAGFFNAYGNPVRKDSVDYVVHLGDYIYEYKPDSDIGRNALPDRETYSLYDYRKRLATYRTDPDLASSHQQFPWIPVWDDHEVANNAWRNGSSNSDGEVFRKRKMAAVRAYFEWMPLRQVDMDDSLRIWRSFSFGSLLDLMMLDTRQYDRDITVLNGIAGIGGNSDEIEEIYENENRTLMGFKQEAWLYDQLSASANRGAAWRVIGSQVIFSRITLGIFTSNPVNYDQWDGYVANRNRVLQHLYDNNIGNNIMLAGDSHASWVSDLAWLDEKPYDSKTGEGAIGVELAGTAVSSSSPIGSKTPKFAANLASQWLIKRNPELQWQDLYYRGYYEMSINYDKLDAKFFGVPSVKVRSPDEIEIAKFEVLNGANKLSRNPTVGGGYAKSGALKGGRVELF